MLVMMVLGFVDGSEELEPAIVDASKSSVMFEVIEREKTIVDASSELLVNHLRHMNKDYNKNLLKKVFYSITQESRFFPKYWLKFFLALLHRFFKNVSLQ